MTALLGSQLTDGIMRQSAFTSDHDYCTTNDTRSGHQHPQNISTKVESISDLELGNEIKFFKIPQHRPL